MDKKLYFRLIFYLIGTFIAVVIFTIVAINFIKDSRLLNKTVVEETAGTYYAVRAELIYNDYYHGIFTY